MEWYEIYLGIGVIYVSWLLIVNIFFRMGKNYVIDPREEQVTNKTAFTMGVFASHLLAMFLWPLVIAWRVIEYEYMDQKSMFYEQEFDKLKAELQRIGVMGKDDNDGE